MPIFTIYCDDSGTDPGNRVAVVAGYLGQVAQWEYFKKEWISALKDFGVKRMRRSDLENFKGEFKDNWNEDRRRKFLQRLHPIIRHRTKIPIGSAVIKEDFEAIIPDNVKAKFGGVYGWCVHDCVVAFSVWCEKHHYRKPIQWVFEAGTTGHGQVGAMFRFLYNDEATRDKYHIKGWSFVDKSAVPLQSADVLAYEVFKQVENQIVDKGKRAVRISLQHLVHNSDDRYLKYWGERRLTEWLDEWNTRGHGSN